MFNSLLAEKLKWYPILFDTTENAVSSVLFWLTLAIAAALIVLLFALKGEKREKFLKASPYFIVPYAALLAVYFFVRATVNAAKGGEIVGGLFIPMVILLVILAAGAFVLAKLRSKPAGFLIGALVAIGVAAVLAFVSVRYYNGAGAKMNEMPQESVMSLWLYVSAAAIAAAIFIIAAVADGAGRWGFETTRSISFAAVCIAMSFALSYLKIFRLPQGGSVTVASLLPLMIYAYVFGCKKGVIAGMIYGLMQAMSDPYIVHPAQFLLDYIFAFAAVGLAGLFCGIKAFERTPQLAFALGALAGGVMRFICHLLAGVFAFNYFAQYFDWAGGSAWIYSLGYNSFVFADIAIVIVAGVFVFSSRTFLRAISGYHTGE
ncbi:MAG: energy-coupled thiamine transporter ThiT [Clostridia bacterium]|nr:energy-coupled thiamine transporter ThiT [Clostridia bacterium]